MRPTWVESSRENDQRPQPLLKSADLIENIGGFGNVWNTFTDAPPALVTLFIDQEGSADGNILVTFSFGMQQAILANYGSAGITEDGKLFVHFLVPYQVGMLLVICADRDDSRVKLVKLGFVLRELAQLLHSKKSPITTVEDQDNAGTTSSSEMERLSVLILEREIGSGLAVNEGQLRFGNPHQQNRKQADNQNR
jgi:hypothetical protein